MTYSNVTKNEIANILGFSPQTVNGNFKAFVKARANQGIIITEVGFRGSAKVYNVILPDNNDGYEWVDFPGYENKYLICKEGKIKNKRTGNITNGNIHPNGYVYFSIQTDINTKKNFPAHRILMMTFNPTDDMDNKIVDHINGIRSDNRLENLRWTSQSLNVLYKNQNWSQILSTIEKLISIYGYEETNKKLQHLLEETM